MFMMILQTLFICCLTILAILVLVAVPVAIVGIYHQRKTAKKNIAKREHEEHIKRMDAALYKKAFFKEIA